MTLKREDVKEIVDLIKVIRLLQKEAFEAGRLTIKGNECELIDDLNGNYIHTFIPKYETFEDYLSTI